MTHRVCVSTSKTETHCHEHDPQGCHLQQWWPLVGPSTAAAPLLSIASLLLLAQRREKDLRKQNNSQKKEKKLKNSLSCPEPRKESKQPLLQMTLLPASCGEAGVFITTTGAEGRAALQGPAPRSHPCGARVPRWQSWLMLRVPLGLQVHMSLTPWANVSPPRAGPGMAMLQGYPHCDIFQGIFGASRASPAPPAASHLLAGVGGSWQGKRRRCRASPFLLFLWRCIRCGA